MVGNPCNTNALIALMNAPTLNPRNFHALTRLDEVRLAVSPPQRRSLAHMVAELATAARTPRCGATDSTLSSHDLSNVKADVIHFLSTR